MSFAADSQTTTPTGNKRISEFYIGNDITVWTPNGTETKQIKFSSGTTDGYQHMMYLAIDNGDLDYRDIIVDQEQPMMMADRQLKRAGQLQPGDELLNADGRPVMLSRVSMGRHKGGVHSVQTSGAEQGTDGHLIIVNGVVCGDFQVQMEFGRE